MATVKLFGAFQDMAGWAERDIEVATLGEAMDRVAEAYPGLDARIAHGSTLVILNATIIPTSLRDREHPLAASDEVAFGPAVSGG